MVLHLVVLSGFCGIRLHSPPIRFKPPKERWDDRGHDGPRGIPKDSSDVFGTETECELDVTFEGAEAGLVAVEHLSKNLPGVRLPSTHVLRPPAGSFGRAAEVCPDASLRGLGWQFPSNPVHERK